MYDLLNVFKIILQKFQEKSFWNLCLRTFDTVLYEFTEEESGSVDYSNQKRRFHPIEEEAA